MIAKLSAAALLLALAVPVLAQTTATITQGPTEACTKAVTDGTAPATDCPAATPAKLGAGIIPLASSDHDSDGEDDEGEDD